MKTMNFPANSVCFQGEHYGRKPAEENQPFLLVVWKKKKKKNRKGWVFYLTCKLCMCVKERVHAGVIFRTSVLYSYLTQILIMAKDCNCDIAAHLQGAEVCAYSTSTTSQGHEEGSLTASSRWPCSHTHAHRKKIVVHKVWIFHK